MDNSSNQILSTIFDIFNSFFSSIDNSIYTSLDNIAFIDEDIFYSHYLDILLGNNASSSILIIANSLLIGFVIYFAFRFLFSSLSLGKIKSPYNFILKIIIVGILMNNSLFICKEIIYLFSIISSSIREIGHNLLNTTICYSNLVKILNSIVIIEENTESIFSIDGIVKTIVSIGLINLIFVFSVRFILIRVFVLLSPFAFLCLSLSSTIRFFKTWLKSFISLLFIECFSSLILIVMFSINYSPSDIVSKFLFVGSVFALMKVNNYVRDIIGGVSIDFQNSMHSLRNIINYK